MERKLKLRRSGIRYQQHTSPAAPTEPTGMLTDEKKLPAPRDPARLSPGRNAVSNGGVNLHNSFRSLQGVPSVTKVNGSDLGKLSSKSIQPRKISVMPAMSPTSLGWDREHLLTVDALADWSDDLNPKHRSAVFETSCSLSARASVHRSGKSRSNSLTPQSVRTNNLPGSVAGQDSLRNGLSQKHSFVKPAAQMVQRSTSGRLGSTHMERGFAQQAQISQRRESGRTFSAERFTNLSPRQSAEKPLEMTIKRAIELLDKINEEELISAAAYIQSQCFRKCEAKVQVHSVHGAKKLVWLLQNDNEEVQRAAAAALRNVVYNNSDNKKDVTDENGLTIILKLLNKTHDKETVCQLAGVLWNLSSDDTIKKLFNENSLDILTKVILVPFSHINGEPESKLDLIADPNAFLCATACLRNLSSEHNHRRNMKSCENLIDSLAFYTTDAAAKCTPDDKFAENCVCILQNLTFEAEKDWILQTTKKKEEAQQNTTPKETTCSCFPYRHANLGKYEVQENQLPSENEKELDAKDKEEAEKTCLLQNNEDPCGVKWLWSGQLVRAYLSLLACSKNKMTLQAAMGALQNLTVGKGEISESVTRIIEEERGPRKITTVLENEITLKKPALLLMRNLSRFPELHLSIFDVLLATNNKKSLLHRLSAEESAELMPILCRILVNLSENNVQTAMYLSRETAVNDMLQKTYEGKAEQAVEQLRHTLACRSLHKPLNEVKNKKWQNFQQLLPKTLQCRNGAKHEEIPSTLFHNQQ